MKNLLLVWVLLFSLNSTAFASGEQLGNKRFSGNCVLYVRSIPYLSDLPRGLYTIRDKVRIINLYRPIEESVVVIKTKSRTGHVAVVLKYEPGYGIWIEEANWKRRKITHRWISESDPSIVGYWISPTILANKIQFIAISILRSSVFTA